MRLASVSYFWFLPSLRLFPGDDFITRRICTGLSDFFRAAVYETLVPCVNAVGFPSAFTSSSASGSLFTGNNTGKRRSSWPCPFTEEKRAARFRAARREDEFRLVAGRFRSVLQTLQRVVERKTAGLLARREF